MVHCSSPGGLGVLALGAGVGGSGGRRVRAGSGAAAAAARADPDREHRARARLGRARAAGSREGLRGRAIRGRASITRVGCYVLPNGDVLVAETNAPPEPETARAFAGWLMKNVIQRSGQPRCRAPIASRCCATRMATASPKRAASSCDGLQLAVRHGAGRRRALRREHRAVVRFPYRAGDDAIDGDPAIKVADLPAGPLNHHWTKNLHRETATARGSTPRSARTATSLRTGIESEEGRARDPRDRSGDRPDARVFASGLRNPNGLAWQPAPVRSGRSSTSATSSATTSCPTT